jgi:hypothetical protein
MNRKPCSVLICIVVLMVVTGCSKKGPASKVVVEVPSGFTGDFLLEMGVKEAPPLEKRGDAFVVTVPRDGKLVTSTLLTNPEPTFQNSSDGGIWGYSHLIFTTGDGIPTGGKIEFFVGTRKEYEAEQGRKNHSEGFAVAPVASTA